MNFAISVVDTPADAPIYNPAAVDLLVIKKCIVVGKGTEEGLPTVDIQLESADGKQYLAMTTGRLMETLAAVIVGKRERDEAAKKN